MAYKLLFIVILVIGYLIYNQYNSDGSRRKYITFSAIVLGLQSALRNVAVGADTYNYYLKFEAVKYTTWQEVFRSFPVPIYMVRERIREICYSEKIISVFSG